MIRLNNVNKYYNRKKSNEIHVIGDTSLVLEEKGLVTFLGPSGCGKTTLLNAIGGLDKIHSGEIWLDDDKIRKICDLQYPVRLVITLGYAAEGDKLRAKKRKELGELVGWK